MCKKIFIFSIVSVASFLSVPSAVTLAHEITPKQLFNHTLIIHKLIKSSSSVQTHQPQLEQIAKRQWDEQSTQTNTYYNPELWTTYQRLQSQTNTVPTRSVIAVYIGAKALVGQQQTFGQTQTTSQGKNSAKLAKEALIFLRKNGYLHYFHDS